MKKIILVCLMLAFFFVSCTDGRDNATNLRKAEITTEVDAMTGLTVEQKNVAVRIQEDNKIGAVKHLYVISAYSGQVLIYSTVKGKVTSSGKRLNPQTLTGQGEYGGSYYFVDIRGKDVKTGEVMQDDGTYGSSVDYIYWWDTKGIYHQHYVVGGQIVHISDQPLVVKSIVINMNLE